jgi:hypothetical protein
MPNSTTFTTFFNHVKTSISDGTFAKLTLAKTIGQTELQNIYVRTAVVDNHLKLALTFKIYKDGLEEIVKECEIENMEAELVPYMNNPFLSALLFTTEADVTMKLNKKRVASIIEQANTFKNADPILLDYIAKSE